MKHRYGSAFLATLAFACVVALAGGVAAKTAAHKATTKHSTAATEKSDAKTGKDAKAGTDAKAGKTESKTAKRSGKKGATAKSEHEKSKSRKTGTAAAPLPPVRPGAVSASTPDGSGADTPEEQAPQISDPNVALVKRAIENLRSGPTSNATQIEASIPDPAARKLVEWIILRNENNGVGSARYVAFMAANPNWPSPGTFRRRAEAMLWVENPKPGHVLRFFADSPPQSAKGRLVLARALMAQGDSEGAKAQVREAWRSDSMSADLEKQVLENYSEFLGRTDHKARMETRLFAGDSEAALRTARRLGDAQVAIARARIALNGKDGTASKQLEAVPGEARQDPGYAFALARALRRDKKIAKAAQVMLVAPNDLSQIHASEGWWLERRDLARKLLDIGDPRSAYQVVRDAAEPTYENSRVERHFMAGWIALRFLDDPATAATHSVR